MRQCDAGGKRSRERRWGEKAGWEVVQSVHFRLGTCWKPTRDTYRLSLVRSAPPGFGEMRASYLIGFAPAFDTRRRQKREGHGA